MIRNLPLALINPYDMGHMSDGNGGFICPTDEDTQRHRDGAEHCRNLIRQGYQIRPIVVTPVTGASYQYQRCDGFKRYYGHKLEGLSRIPCLVIPDYRPGCQEGMSMAMDEEAPPETDGQYWPVDLTWRQVLRALIFTWRSNGPRLSRSGKRRG